jgi:hypothetical protein
MTEQELLSIVETLTEVRNILLGQRIKVHTDHENLKYKNNNADQVMMWRLYIEENTPDLQYIKGAHNTVADTLSRLYDGYSIWRHIWILPWINGIFCKKAPELPEFHPLNYQHLKIAQEKDKTSLNILKLKNNMFLKTSMEEEKQHPWYASQEQDCYS